MLPRVDLQSSLYNLNVVVRIENSFVKYDEKINGTVLKYYQDKDIYVHMYIDVVEWLFRQFKY